MIWQKIHISAEVISGYRSFSKKLKIKECIIFNFVVSSGFLYVFIQYVYGNKNLDI